MPNIKEADFWPPRERSPIYKFEKCPVNYMTREQYTEWHNNGTLFDTKFHEENIIKPRSKDLLDNIQQDRIKQLEKVFQSKMEDCVEDVLVFEKDIEPYSHFL